MQISRSPVVTAVLLLAVSTGCGGNTTDEPAPATDTTKPAATSATPTGVPPNIGPSALTVGQTRQGRAISTTVLEVRDRYRDAGYQPPTDGKRWIGVNVKSCITGDLGGEPAVISWYDFQAASDDGATYPAAMEMTDGFPAQPYPFTETNLTEGCRKGWLLIPVPEADKIDLIRVADPGGGSATAEWRLKQ